MSRPIIVLGDKTDHGGTVISASTTMDIDGKGVARVGDKVICPKHGPSPIITTIATGDPTNIVDGQPIARHGDKTACGATLISSQAASVVDSGAAARGSDLSDVASGLATPVGRSNATITPAAASAVPASSPAPTTNPCVFALSCFASGPMEARTAPEPASHFGALAVMAPATEQAAPSGAAAGTIALGRAVGSSAALDGLGTWAARILGAGATTAGTMFSAVVIGAMIPQRMGDGTLTEEQLQSMGRAPTRVRFRWVQDDSGQMQLIGRHTGPGQNDSVPVVQAVRNGSRFEAHVGGIEITWTPNAGPVATAPTTFPGLDSRTLPNVLVHPISEEPGSEATVYPAPEDITLEDVIVVFPADSGVEPLYLVFAKPAVKPLEVGPANDLQSRSKGDGMDIDHIPSQAALRQYLLANAFEISDEDIKAALAAAPGMTIPRRVHQRYSETYGGRNSRERQVQDAADLKAAVDSNMDALTPALQDEGFSSSEIEAARERLHQLHREQGWYE